METFLLILAIIVCLSPLALIVYWIKTDSNALDSNKSLYLFFLAIFIVELIGFSIISYLMYLNSLVPLQ